jgi:CheY-like chemotaxis protein
MAQVLLVEDDPAIRSALLHLLASDTAAAKPAA